jgi:hypothetical protein
MLPIWEAQVRFGIASQRRLIVGLQFGDFFNGAQVRHVENYLRKITH